MNSQEFHSRPQLRTRASASGRSSAASTVADWTDIFCGAGGSTSGIKRAHPQVEVRLALNHWGTAIETHQLNHPTTGHYLVDVARADPRWFRRTRCAWMSPECKTFSRARVRAVEEGEEAGYYPGQEEGLGGRAVGAGPLAPDVERSRANAWDVIRFVEYHHYDVFIVENVVRFAKWRLYPVWLTAIAQLGYAYKEVYLNSMHCGVPQSRDRYYLVAWRKTMRAPDLEFRPLAPCPKCARDVESQQSWKRPDYRWGRYREQSAPTAPVPWSRTTGPRLTWWTGASRPRRWGRERARSETIRCAAYAWGWPATEPARKLWKPRTPTPETCARAPLPRPSTLRPRTSPWPWCCPPERPPLPEPEDRVGWRGGWKRCLRARAPSPYPGPPTYRRGRRSWTPC
jgi:site-specific DNA-cytosine methylase